MIIFAYLKYSHTMRAWYVRRDLDSAVLHILATKSHAQAWAVAQGYTLVAE